LARSDSSICCSVRRAGQGGFVISKYVDSPVNKI
jgi:hypothetical protein